MVKMAEQNPSWGYTRTRGALQNLGHELGRSTIKRILDEHGIDPAPERGTRTCGGYFAHPQARTGCPWSSRASVVVMQSAQNGARDNRSASRRSR